MREAFIGSLSDGVFRANDEERWKSLRISEAQISVVDLSKLKPKQKMYNYLNGIFYPWAHQVFVDKGYEISPAAVIEYLERRFLEEQEIDPDGEVIKFVKSQRDWSFDTLKNYLDMVIMFMATNLSAMAPDAVAYLANEESKKTYRNIVVQFKTKEDFQ